MTVGNTVLQQTILTIANCRKGLPKANYCTMALLKMHCTVE